MPKTIKGKTIMIVPKKKRTILVIPKPKIKKYKQKRIFIKSIFA